jgi:radical SAM protein with 4Fe4S-binding SPASM domain
MTPEVFERVLQNIQGHGDHIYLHVKGEPLYHSHFPEILSLGSKYNKKLNITTNGTLLHKHQDAILNCPAVRLVNLSLQSFENHSNRDAYYEYLSHVYAFIEQGLKSTQIIFELRIWNGASEKQLSVNYVDTVQYFEEKLGFTIPVTRQNTKGLSGKSQIYISSGYEFEWPSLSNDFASVSGNCYGLRRQIAILSDGTVVPCCLDADGEIALGNILQDDFQSIVTSPRAVAIRTGFENRKIIEPLCQHCSYREQYV